MIKKLLFLVLLGSYALANGQSYKRMLIQDTTTWQHFGYILGVKSLTNNVSVANNALAALDTISFSGLVYRKLYDLGAPAFLSYNNKSLTGFIREDSTARKVYFKESVQATEFVLYDFSLNTGDSTSITFPNNNSYSGYYRVDSIITKNELCGPRRHFFMRRHINNNQWYQYYEWIESIGSTYHLLYPYDGYMFNSDLNFPNGCKAIWENGLACKKNNDSLMYRHCSSLYPSYWGNTYYNQCTYYYFSGGLQNQQFHGQITVYPNPVNNRLMVDFNAEDRLNLSLRIHDLTGRTVLEQKNISLNAGENKREINISMLQPGAYSLIMEAGNTRSSRIIMIEP